MLPEFPEIKRAFSTRIIRKFESKRAETIHIFDRAPKIILHEGTRLVMVNESGAEQEIEMKLLSVQFSFSDEELAGMTTEQIHKRFEEAAEEMGRQQLGLAYDEINRSVTNVVDSRGQQLGPEHILQALEKMQMDFDGQGRPKLPTFVTHPDQFDRYKEAIENVKSTPQLRARFDEVIALKKEEWRARESSRKLVG